MQNDKPPSPKRLMSVTAPYLLLFAIGAVISLAVGMPVVAAVALIIDGTLGDPSSF